MVGKGTEAKLGTAKEVVITPHCVPDHWCCTTVDSAAKKSHTTTRSTMVRPYGP